MANRKLKDGICTSDSINLLTAEEEVLFYRLLVVADDLGNMDGRPSIIKSICYPLKDTLALKTVGLWITGLENAGLIMRYKTKDEKIFINILKWDQRIRSNAKYPSPDGCEVLTIGGNKRPGFGFGLGLGLGFKKESTKEKSFYPVKRLMELEVDKQIANDWIILRNKRRAATTETVINTAINEAAISNITLNQALTISIDKNWQTFKSKWYSESLSNDFKGSAPTNTIANSNNDEWRNSDAGIRRKGEELNKPALTLEKPKSHRARLDKHIRSLK